MVRRLSRSPNGGVVTKGLFTSILRLNFKLSTMERTRNRNAWMPSLMDDFMYYSSRHSFPYVGFMDYKLKFLDEKILRNWGVPLCILTGDYTKEQYEAYYQKTIEPLVITFTQAFTKGLFTTREKALGNRVEFLPEKLVFMSIGQIIEMVKQLSQTGGLYENEKRVAFGLPPLEELKGKRYMSLNWINADDASAYQVGNNKNVNVDIVDEEREDV